MQLDGPGGYPTHEALSTALVGQGAAELAPPLGARELAPEEIWTGVGETALRVVEELPVDNTPEEAYTKRYQPENGDLEVHVSSRVTPEDYERITPAEDMELLNDYAEQLQGKKIMFINATAAGGGVAIMRSPMINLMNLVGVDASWHALQPDEEKNFFDVSKQKFHNVLQDVHEDKTIRLNKEDETIYDSVIEQNAKALEKPLSEADVIVIDDWQPSGLIPHLKGGLIPTGGGLEYREGINPGATILFRDHIHTEGELMGTEGTPQHTTWKFIWDHNRVNEADAFITHPKDEFVPPDVPDAKTVFMPATADPVDDLNRPLSEAEAESGYGFINDQLYENEGQKPIDLRRPYIALIARFDPSKGMPQGMESYVKARNEMVARGVSEEDLPQLVVVGNGSIDDPDGGPLLKEMMDIRGELPEDVQDDIKIARVPHNDVAINAILKGASLALQPSTKEGFESRVTDAILQGVPVIGSDRGGIPLQIVPGKSGYVVNPYDTNKWAEHITKLMTDICRARPICWCRKD